MFQVQVEDCLRGDSDRLVSLLRDEGLTIVTLNSLDQVVTKVLSGSGFSRVLVVLKSLEILSENREELQTLVDHGLTPKVLLWFEAVRDLLTSDLHKSSVPLLSLTEEFYNYFLVLAQSLPVRQLSVVLLQLAQFTLEPEINFPLRLEAIRTFNSILESLNREQRRLIQNQNQILAQLAAAVLTVGDYELQVSLSEALCRLTPKKDRQQRANQWFSSSDISSAFCDIRDGDFEVDCRRFLNFVNCSHGDQRRVFTFPCVRAFLDSTELFPPQDEKLDNFWIDFNFGSGCVSFFVEEPQGFLWGSVHLMKEDVLHYSVQIKHHGCTSTEMVFSVQLNNPIMHHNSRGQTVELSFNCEHQRELEEAAERVFMRRPSGGTVQAPPPGRSYSRKKPQSKSQLKILPLSSPSSDEDSSVMKTSGNRSEFLFDQIRLSTPTLASGVTVGAELGAEPEETFGGSSSPFQQEVSSRGRKRSAADSGFLSDQTEGTTAHKKRVEPQAEGEESNSTVTSCSLEGAGPSGEEAGSSVKPLNPPGTEPESDPTPDISAAFKRFTTQVQQQLTGRWQTIETEVLLSLKECQQQMTSLLTAVHQHRLLFLQRFENSITDQLNQLEENSTNLNNMNTNILSFLQSQMKRLGSFCDEQQQRLKCLENGDSENLSSK
ncbi:synaptonemal complex protein 2-like [Scophthalmus maximus]|uniref:synaptonemal complex protein 2-like n=1 Tax=Scophthalmus maximus TaxID=52904 RepID=UPI001FA93159|nr:synaptonemal complex protein 2-like [Scophthalmus maximus]